MEVDGLLAKLSKVKIRTRNVDLLDICDVLEEVLRFPKQERLGKEASPWRDPETGKFDRTRYQREYMRKRRGSKNPFTA